MRLQTLLAAAAAATVSAFPSEWADTSLNRRGGSHYQCKTYPGDSGWPSASKWKQLNRTVDGNLFLNTPPGAVCYDTFDGYFGDVDTYDADACSTVQANFNDEQWVTDQPSAGMWTYFTNDTCRPDTMTETCTPGGYGVYVIMATDKAHVRAGMKFADKYNLRLIIRNTGHDFIGRSVGWGSLIINTHSFKDIDFTDSWSGPGYSGPAVTIGAGVQGRELLEAANALTPPRMVVVGECPTVGVAGGFVQGGGHGPMTTVQGFAADNAVQFEVITASGTYLTVNSASHADLFWALKGGGPGNYAVVLSVTLKTFVDQVSSGMTLYINNTHTTDYDLFWDAFGIFSKYSTDFVNNGLYVYYEIGQGVIFGGGYALRIRPFVAVGQTLDELQAVVQPFLDELDALEVPYESSIKEFDTLFDLYTDMFEAEYASSTALTGGWMFTHDDINNNNDGVVEAFKTVVDPREDLEGWMVGHLWDAGHGMPVSNSATHPKFREAVNFVITILTVDTDATWAEKEDLQEVLTYTMDEALREAGPNGATYVNEADPYQPNWQENFWGDVYPALKALKKKWDPDMLFYSVSLPGTEEWEVINYGRELCKTS